LGNPAAGITDNMTFTFSSVFCNACVEVMYSHYHYASWRDK